MVAKLYRHSKQVVAVSAAAAPHSGHVFNPDTSVGFSSAGDAEAGERQLAVRSCELEHDCTQVVRHHHGLLPGEPQWCRCTKSGQYLAPKGREVEGESALAVVERTWG